MTLPVIIHPAAEQEINHGRSWYNDISPELAADFARRVLDSLELIQTNPHLYANIGSGLHRAILRQFPDQVFYRIGRDRINVLAVVHSHADRRHVLKHALRRERQQ